MEEYNQKEENTFRKDLFHRLDTQDDLLKEIKTQTVKTNGRVTVLETRLEDYDENKKILAGLSGFKMWLTGAVAVLLLCGGTLGYAYSEIILSNADKNATKIFEASKIDLEKQLEDKISEALSNYQ